MSHAGRARYDRNDFSAQGENSLRDYLLKKTDVAQNTMILDVIVKPGSKQPGLSEESGMLVLRVRERAVEGAANVACIGALAVAYGVPRSAVELIGGVRSRRKRFAISFRDKTTLMRRTPPK